MAIKKVYAKGEHGTAVRITARFEGKTQDYALAWLHLTNNAREYPNVFLKIYNTAGDRVIVVTPEKWRDSVKEYLTGLSGMGVLDKDADSPYTDFKVTILDEEIVPTIKPLVDWDADFEDVMDDFAEVLPAGEYFR